jgi:single-strand DNA-binding protein
MKTFAEFEILGRVGKITPAGPALKIAIAADYGRRDDQGDWQQNTYWNTVTVFSEKTVAWLRDNLSTGDLVLARGTLRDHSYEKDGATLYSTTFAATSVDRLAKKAAGDHRDDED